MKLRWPVVILSALAALLAASTLAADPALARTRHKVVAHKVKAHCVDRPFKFTWSHIWNAPEPKPNGCSPPVFVDGQFIGQDPDPNIRHQLTRDPDTGYKQLY